MLEVTVIEAGESATLSHAILLYGCASRSGGETRFSTIHEVDAINGRPEIMPGRLLNEMDLVTLAKSLASTEAGNAVATKWFDGNVLANGSDRLIWWTPPGNRAMFFETSSQSPVQVHGQGSCPVPGLVWVAMPNQGLFIYAVKGGLRPTQETALFQAPFFNVWGRGKVCVGNADLPSAELQWNTLAWEHMFFGSRFTHPNFAQKDRLLKGVHPGHFWKRMLAKPAETFPEKHLVAMPLVIGDLLNRSFLSQLAGLPKPQGEF